MVFLYNIHFHKPLLTINTTSQLIQTLIRLFNPLKLLLWWQPVNTPSLCPLLCYFDDNIRLNERWWWFLLRARSNSECNIHERWHWSDWHSWMFHWRKSIFLAIWYCLSTRFIVYIIIIIISNVLCSTKQNARVECSYMCIYRRRIYVYTYSDISICLMFCCSQKLEILLSIVWNSRQLRIANGLYVLCICLYQCCVIHVELLQVPFE